MKRQFIKGMNYYLRALDLARKHGLHEHQGRLCRDLAYVHLHHQAYSRALDLINEGLSIGAKDPEVHFGLLANKISVHLMQQEYFLGLETVEQAIRYFNATFPKISTAPSQLVVGYASLLSIRRDLKRVTELIDTGVNPDRIQISVKLSRPRWADK